MKKFTSGRTKINGTNKWYEEKEKKDAHEVKKEQLYIFFCKKKIRCIGILVFRIILDACI